LIADQRVEPLIDIILKKFLRLFMLHWSASQ
jgi:hypothetical protein